MSRCIVHAPRFDLCAAQYGNEDMGYKNFVCVESAQAASAVPLKPGEYWTGAMEVKP